MDRASWSDPLPARPRSAALGALCLAWLLAAGAGAALLARYAGEPGAPAAAPASWPRTSALDCDPGGPTLVVFVHPRCPCTRASLEELAKTLARARRAPRLWINLFVPAGEPEAWAQTDLCAQAARLPGARLHFDRGGVEAARFGAQTSGQALLYGARGALEFAGGLTISRGHAGDSPGGAALADLLGGAAPAAREALVFGCPLSDPNQVAALSSACAGVGP